MLRRKQLTLGVEEEYFLVDPVSRALHPGAGALLADAALGPSEHIGAEMTQYQIEVRTEPSTRLADVGEQIRAVRKAVAAASARQGLRIVSSGSPILGRVVPPQFTEGPHYARSVAAFRALDHELSACACHIHVGVDDLSQALWISNQIRPWLPLLVALSANSPYWDGRDTGYASWRTMAWAQWPVAGPPPYFESAAHFDELVGRLIATGAILDRSTLYWDVRPSTHVPTVEIRVADAALTSDDTLLLAAVIRGLAATALDAVAAGAPALRPEPEFLRAAYWRAARDGLTGHGLDLPTGRQMPATALVDRLLMTIAPALARHGDLELVRAGWSRLQADGSGACRQRAAYRRRASLSDVVDDLIDRTDPRQALPSPSASE
ncbi:glutamate--cysteine ligase [Streptomyces sioyaensis]|uniref:carboxylate-amine ligase n=1 Tax=Streptomyces sioyaensis TaxID=67364 RepID=UPI00365D62B3